MELINQNELIAEKWALVTAKVLFCAGIFVSIVVWAVLIFGYQKDVGTKIALPQTSVSSLGLGPFALNPLGNSSQIQPILRELVLIGANTRPDQDHDRICSLALRTSGEEKNLSVGETFFFKLNEGQIFFSKENTDLSLTAKSLEGNQLVCEIKNKNSSELCTLSSSAIFSTPLDQEPYVEILKKGCVWGKDMFLSGWGGEEYREMTAKVKVSLGPDVYFLKPGDCLWWNGGMWLQQIESDEICPIAQVVKANTNGATLQVWDSTGFSTQTILLPAQSFPKTSLKLDELMTAIRPRSPSEITCQLGKRRVIVREGDWWIRSGDRWKPLRSSSDLDAFLAHQIPGELFIFEKVETSKGKVTLKGRVFDQMRTSSEPISIVMQTEKKSTTARKPSTGTPHLAKEKSRHPVITHSEDL